MIDVDEFKAVNDAHGHAAGDGLLQTIGAAITETLRGHDFAARVGGDEFAVLLPNAGAHHARAIAGRIREAVSASTDLPVTVSIGLAPLTADIRGSVLSADSALYEAKRAGKDRLVARVLSQPAPTSTEASTSHYVSMSRLEIPPERAPEMVAAFQDPMHLQTKAERLFDLPALAVRDRAGAAGSTDDMRVCDLQFG